MAQAMVKRFFGSTENLQETLKTNILKAMHKRDIKPEELDRRCLFGWNGLPKTQEFMDDATRITAPVVSLAAFALGLSAEQALGIKKGEFRAKLEENKTWLLRHMKTNKAYLAAAHGDVRNAADISPEDLLPVYVILKCVEALEPQSKSETATSQT